ncbi:MAG TPA: hypothetical protein VF381_05935 [Thermoanaerobaculia bacterium]
MFEQVKGAVAGFLGMIVALMALTAAMKAGLIDIAVMRRTTGLILGATAILVGNVFPKVRPLAMLTGSRNQSAAAERLAGWVLVLAGAVYIGAFLFAPLADARRVSSIAGIIALLAIAVSWTWLAISGGSRPPVAGAAVKPRILMLWLFLAFIYVLATACFGFLFGPSWWLVVVFWLAYAALSALIDVRRRTT